MTFRALLWTIAGLTLVADAGAQTRATGPGCATLACDVQAEFDRTRALIMGAVTAMPEDKFGFRPTAEERTFAEQALHVATIDVMLLGTVGAKSPVPKVNDKLTSKAEVEAELMRVFDFDAAVLKEFATDAQLLERVRSIPLLGPTVSRLRVVLYALTHTQDIYGQLVVYLRLNGVTPPASVRP